MLSINYFTIIITDFPKFVNDSANATVLALSSSTFQDLTATKSQKFTVTMISNAFLKVPQFFDVKNMSLILSITYRINIF